MFKDDNDFILEKYAPEGVAILSKYLISISKVLPVAWNSVP